MSPEMTQWHLERGLPVFVSVYGDGTVGVPHATRHRAAFFQKGNFSLRRVPRRVGLVKVKLKGVEPNFRGKPLTVPEGLR